MSISKTQVEHVAVLARLALSKEEVERYTEQMNKILQFADKLSELDTEGVEPTSHVLPMANVLRGDERQESLARDEALLNAPAKKDGLFVVPAVFDA